jgi:tRNA 2-thiouridine synthesizing protein A
MNWAAFRVSRKRVAFTAYRTGKLNCLELVNCDVTLDTSGLNCPLPILKTKKALASMASGQVLYVIATDPASSLDFAAFSARTGHVLLDSREEGGKYYYWLRKA